MRSSLDKTFAKRYMDLDGGFTPLNFMFPNLPLPSYYRRDRAHKAMSDFYVDILRKRRAGPNDAEHDMMASLMGQSYKDGRELSEREIAHILIALLMAGQHTSSATSSWMLLHVADHPEVGYVDISSENTFHLTSLLARHCTTSRSSILATQMAPSGA